MSIHWALKQRRQPHRFSKTSAAIAWSFLSTGKKYVDVAVVERRRVGEFPTYHLYEAAILTGHLPGRPSSSWTEGTEADQAIEEYAFWVFDSLYESHQDRLGYQLKRDHVIGDHDVALDRIQAFRVIRDAAGSVNDLEGRLRRARSALNGVVARGLDEGLTVIEAAAAANLSRQAIYDIKKRLVEP